LIQYQWQGKTLVFEIDNPEDMPADWSNEILDMIREMNRGED
jgi:hypothetical protein